MCSFSVIRTQINAEYEMEYVISVDIQIFVYSEIENARIIFLS